MTETAKVMTGLNENGASWVSGVVSKSSSNQGCTPPVAPYGNGCFVRVMNCTVVMTRMNMSRNYKSSRARARVRASHLHASSAC